MELLPTWPGIEPDSQKSVAEMITEMHFLDWGFDIFKLQVNCHLLA